MTQNKTDYTETYPNCRVCGEVMKFTDGEVVSIEAYQGLEGVCNHCLSQIQGKNCFKLVMKGN